MAPPGGTAVTSVGVTTLVAYSVRWSPAVPVATTVYATGRSNTGKWTTATSASVRGVGTPCVCNCRALRAEEIK